MHRLAGAPISWGVCEVPNWGHQLDPDSVLGEMAELGLSATEHGPPGFLPEDAGARAALLARHGLSGIAAFVAVVLHEGPAPSASSSAGQEADISVGADASEGSDDPTDNNGTADSNTNDSGTYDNNTDSDPVHQLQPTLDALAADGAEVLVVAASTGADGYDTAAQLDAQQWQILLRNLDRISAAAAERGLRATIHPHVGTVIETPEQIARVLAGSQIELCLDTGHTFLGGSDPRALAVEHAGRIGHVHLKDLHLSLGEQVRVGGLGYTDAVRAGLYAPVGTGDLDIAGIVTTLEDAGYQGWYVLEQDAVLTSAPEPGSGPINDVRTSLEHLRRLAPGTPA